MPLMLAGITLATSAAAPPPQKVPEVKLPHRTPGSILQRNQPKAYCNGLKSPCSGNASAKLGATSDIFGYLYFFQGTQLERGFYRINPTPDATFLWADSYTSDLKSLRSMTGSLIHLTNQV